jgi:hypothetical protein
VTSYINAVHRDYERTINAQREHIAELEARLATVVDALQDSVEAMGWHGALNFEPSGKNGQTISDIVTAALGMKGTGL